MICEKDNDSGLDRERITCPTTQLYDSSVVRQPVVRQPTCTTAQLSDNSLVRQPSCPKTHLYDNSILINFLQSLNRALNEFKNKRK